MKSCARCGAELRALNAGGLCVRCLLESGLDPAPGGPDLKSAPGPSETIPIRAPDAETEPSFPQEAIRYFGNYELLEEIARGGMGLVYRARHRGLERIVAVKMIAAGQFASKQVIQRFRGEVTAAALLQHPNIVAIHDVGVHEDQHYFSMDYVEGQNLSQLVGTRPLSPARAARYVKLIAEAIHYAHGQGILHRDLKPSNVLVDLATDQPRLTDFGLAKRLDGDASITMTGQMLGSPNFMPPEQADSQRGKVGRQSDVYGLGAILYHLLTARPPFQAESFESVILQVLHAEPVSPRLLNSSVPPDLETICVKCLQKEPSRRYQSAQELADELGRFLGDQPIHARPVTRAERTWRWCRRNPALAGLVAALMLVFTLGFAGTLWQWRHAVRYAKAEAQQRKLADESRERANQIAYDLEMSVAQHTWDDGDLGGTLSALEAHLPKFGEREDRRGFEWYYYWNLCQGDPRITLRGHSNAVECVAFSPDGKLVATGSSGSPVQIWESASGRLRKTLPEQNVVSVAFAPDAEILGVGGRDQVVVWNLETEQPVFKREKDLAKFRIAFLPGGTLVLGKPEGLKRFGHDGGSVELWDYVTGKSKHVFPESGGYIALSPHGDFLATGNWNQTVKIWDLATLQLVRTLKTGGVVTMALSPDGQTLATGDRASEVSLWDIASERRIGWLTNNHHLVWGLAFSPDGRALATGGTDQMVHIWDVETRQHRMQLGGHGSEVVSVDFSVDGQTLVTGSKDRTAILWSVWNVQPPRVTTVSNVLSRPIFSTDGRWVAAGIDQGSVALWDVATFQVQAVFTGARDAVVFLDDGSRLVTRSTNEFLKKFDLSTHPARETVSGGAAAEKDDHAVLSPDGQMLIVGKAKGDLSFFDAKTGGLIETISPAFSGNVFQIVFSPNGKLLAVTGRESEAGRDPAAKIWDVATRKWVVSLIGHTDTVLGVGFSPDGTMLATCGADNTIKFWDAITWKEIPPSIVQKETVNSLSFSPKGRTLASASFDNPIRLWDIGARREVASLQPGLNVAYITFSPDGQTLAAHGWDKLLRLWRAPITDKKEF